MQHKWYLQKRWRKKYAFARIDGEAIQLHRFVLGLERGDGKIVDHINHNGLDNVKSNLRLVNHAQNAWHSQLAKNNASGYKGVSYKTAEKKWRAVIQIDGRRHHIGYFKAAEEAAEAYNREAMRRWGEYAVLNKIRKRVKQR
jgi:hypothetical protein